MATDEIGVTQTTDAALLARAKQTVYALNQYQADPYANVNGFCLSWPPAVRVSERSDSVELVSAFANAILTATGNNGCVHNHGGMLENIGATVAINDLLLQSHGGYMRFFPVWNATELGAASFSTLRAYGAFLVSAAIDDTGLVSPINITSEVGGNVTFDCPWDISWTPGVTASDGSTVHISSLSEESMVYTFATNAGTTYQIRNPRANGQE